MVYIFNDKLSVKISEKGAELTSIQCDGTEYLWQAHPAFWAKHSPVLFPFVGELKDGKYIFQNREYKMGRHGFARERTFAARRTSDISAIFTLQSDNETISIYPFPFIFRVEYALDNSRLKCTYIVEN